MIIVELEVVYWLFDDILLELKSCELIKLLIKLIEWIIHLYDEVVDWLIDNMVIWKVFVVLRKVWIGCYMFWDEL